MMFRRIVTLFMTMMLLTSCVSAFAMSSGDDAITYVWKVEDDFSSYSASALKDFKYDANKTYGTGFAGYWSDSPTGTNAGETCAAKYLSGYTKGYYPMQIGATGSIYRKLANPVNFAETGKEYTFSFNLQIGARNQDFRFLLGQDNLYFGFKSGPYKVVGSEYRSYFAPQLVVGDDLQVIPTEFSDTDYFNGDSSGNKRYNFELTVILRDGEDTFKVRYWLNGSTAPDDYNIEEEIELGGFDTMDYIGFYQLQTNKKDPIWNVSVTDVTSAEELENIYAAVTAGTASAEDCERAFELLYSYNGSDRAERISDVRDFCLANDYDVIYASVKGSADDKKVYCSGEKLELEFSYPLGGNSGGFEVGDDISLLWKQTGIDTVEISFPDGLEPNREYTITPIDVTDYKGDSVDAAYTFETLAVPALNIADGGSYSQYYELEWTDAEGITTEAVLQNSAGETQNIESGYVFNESGDFVLTLKSSVESEDIYDEMTFEFEIFPSQAPEAKDVKILGTAATDEILTGDYDFYDENGDSEDVSQTQYKWYRGLTDDVDSITEPVSDELTYTLTKEDEGYFFVFEVTPVSDSLTQTTGKATKSSVFRGAFAPEITDAKIKNELVIDEYAYLDYKFSDANGDDKGECVYVWFVSDTYDGKPKEVTEHEGDKLKITDEFIGKYLFAYVVPVSVNKPFEGKGVYTKPVLCPVAPVVSGVRIQGDAEVGETLSGYYNYSDANGDEEGNSELKWIDSDGNILGTGDTLKLTSSMEGENIAFSVTGVSKKKPEKSETIISSYVKVDEESSSSVSKGNGGFSYKGGYTSDKEEESIAQPTTPVITPPAVSEGFTDMAGHWAEDYVAKLKEAGVVAGESDSIFNPDRTVTRAEFIKMALSGMGLKEVAYKDSFSDVNINDWFSGYIQAALDNGIISAAESFRPADNISRQEAAKIISIIKNLTPAEKEVTFGDASDISDWALEYVSATAQSGIMVGDDNGNFRPLSSLSRAEAATVVYRIMYGEDKVND